MKFEGTVWRHLPRDGHPLDWGYILEASGRWNRSRYACLYTSTEKDGALAEHIKSRKRNPGYKKPHKLCSIEVELESVWNLSHWNVRDSLGITEEDLQEDSAGGRELCKQIGEEAIHRDYNGILAPSAAIENENNLMIFSPTFTNQIEIRPGGEQINIDYRLIRNFLERRGTDLLF